MRSALLLVALVFSCAVAFLGGCDSLSHPFDDPDTNSLPNTDDYDLSCTDDTECTAVTGGDCGCSMPVAMSVRDAQQFTTDFNDAINGAACNHFNGPFCFDSPTGTISPFCEPSSHTCEIIFCDFSNNCVTR